MSSCFWRGACVWGIFGHIDSTVSTTVRIENGQPVCIVSEENISSVKVGLTVTFENNEAFIETIGDLTDNGYICTLSDDFGLPDGFYEGKITVESYKPLSFILN